MEEIPKMKERGPFVVISTDPWAIPPEESDAVNVSGPWDNIHAARESQNMLLREGHAATIYEAIE